MGEQDINWQLDKLRNERSQIFEASSHGICIIDTNFIIKDVNSAFCQMLGLTKEQLTGKRCLDVYGGDSCHSLECPLKQITSGEKYHRLEREIFGCHGLKIPCVISARPYYDIDGGILGIIQEINDITERNKANEQINQLAAIVESAPDGIFGCSPDGIISYWNKGAEMIFGYTAEEILGQNLIYIIPPESRRQFMRILNQLEKGQAVSRYELQLCNKNQEVRYVSISASPVRDSAGEIITISMITRDLTEMKRIEKEILRMDQLNLVGQMAAGIGHEIRNPMTTVRGFLQLLAKKEADSRKSEYYDIIIEELDRANAIITEFLSLAKSRVVKLQPASINKILNALYPLISSDATKQDKRIILKKGDIPNIPLSEKEIRQLIINLVRNGLDASPPGRAVTIGTYAEKDQVILYVEDEGSGIQPEILDKLGTPFTTTKDEGTGLGLSVCFSIADKHNAKIDVKTSPEGTIFYVRFNLTPKQTD